MEYIFAIYFVDVLLLGGGAAMISFLCIFFGGGAILFSQTFESTQCNNMTKEERDEDSEVLFARQLQKQSKRVLYFGLFLMVYMTLTPSKDAAIAMVAAYAVYDISSNEDVQEFASNSAKVLDLWMKEQLEGLSGTVENASTEIVEVVKGTVGNASTEIVGVAKGTVVKALTPTDKTVTAQVED